MPVVPAAGYPTGPEAPPQISPALPDDFLRIQATPEAFGAQVGAALTRASATAEQAGSELAQAAISRQQFYNSVAADGASTKFMQESHKLLYGDPSAGTDPTTGQPLKPGFYALKGQDAINAGAPVDQLDQLQRQISASLPNDRARLEFNQETRRLRFYMDSEISRHWDEQLKTAGQETSIANIDLANRDGATYFNNPDRFQLGLESALNNAKKWSQIEHGMNADPAVYANDMAKAGTNYYKSGIAAAVGSGNLTRAEEIKNQAVASGYFTGEEVNWADQLIEPKRNRQDGDDAARRAMGLPPRQATGLVPYKPSTDLLSGTGMTAAQYDTFRSTLAARESSSYAQPPNAGGYMGRYQMGTKEIADTAARLGVAVPTQQQFLSDPALQERFFENYTLDHHNQLMQTSQQYRAAGPTERAAILMGAHLGGVKNVQDYLDGKSDLADSNGTRISDYVTMGRRALGGSAAPAATPATNQPAATPAQPTAAAAPGTIEVWGDSLGVGLKGALKAKGNSVGGAQPTAILADIKAQPENSWAGKTVVLSSGSNGRQMDKVEETIKYLQDHNANVVVVGYGTDPKASLPEKNAQLREIAGRLKVPVVDAEEVGPDGIHPSPQGYRSMGEKIRTAAAGRTTAAKPATAGEGAVITGPNGERLQNKGGKWVDLKTGQPYEQQSAGP